MTSTRHAWAVVVAYDPEVSLSHPLTHEDLTEIGNYVEEQWRKKHGFYESAMALYNLCIRLGKARTEDSAT